MAVKLIDPRRALGIVPRDLRLPCCDRWHVPVVVVVGVGCLGLNLTQRCRAAEAHLLLSFFLVLIAAHVPSRIMDGPKKCLLAPSSWGLNSAMRPFDRRGMCGGGG